MEQNKLLQTNNKIMDIEALRGIALLLVLLFHFFSRFHSLFMSKATTFKFGFLFHDFGSLGVAIFLLVSGYFMISKQNNSQINYIIKRLIRLWPAYFLSICICFLVKYIWVLPGRIVSFKEFLLNIFFVNGFMGVHYVDGAHWYLTVLVSAILIFSFIQKLSYKHRQYIYWGCLTILLTLFFFHISNSYVRLMRNNLPIIIMGACLADINRRNIKLASITFIVALLSCFVFKHYSYNYLIILLIVVLLFLLAIKQNCFIFKSKILIWLGTISYPIYLIHQDMGYELMYNLMKYFGEYKVWMSFAAICLGILLGVIIYFIDKKTQRKIRAKSDRNG